MALSRPGACPSGGRGWRSLSRAAHNVADRERSLAAGRPPGL